MTSQIRDNNQAQVAFEDRDQDGRFQIGEKLTVTSKEGETIEGRRAINFLKNQGIGRVVGSTMNELQEALLAQETVKDFFEKDSPSVNELQAFKAAIIKIERSPTMRPDGRKTVQFLEKAAQKLANLVDQPAANQTQLLTEFRELKNILFDCADRCTGRWQNEADQAVVIFSQSLHRLTDNSVTQLEDTVSRLHNILNLHLGDNSDTSIYAALSRVGYDNDNSSSSAERDSFEDKLRALSADFMAYKDQVIQLATLKFPTDSESQNEFLNEKMAEFSIKLTDLRLNVHGCPIDGQIKAGYHDFIQSLINQMGGVNIARSRDFYDQQLANLIDTGRTTGRGAFASGYFTSSRLNRNFRA